MRNRTVGARSEASASTADSARVSCAASTAGTTGAAAAYSARRRRAGRTGCPTDCSASGAGTIKSTAIASGTSVCLAQVILEQVEEVAAVLTPITLAAAAVLAWVSR